MSAEGSPVGALASAEGSPAGAFASAEGSPVGALASAEGSPVGALASAEGSPVRALPKARRRKTEYSNVEESKNNYYEKKLVLQVHEDMSTLKKNDATSAWGSNLEKVKKETTDAVKYKSDKAQTSLYPDWNGEIPVKTLQSKGTRPKNIGNIAMEHVEPRPCMIYYTHTPVNLPTPDSKFLTNMPYLGDDHEKRDKGAFSDELLEMYKGNLHSEDDLQEILPSVDFLNFIRVLMKIGAKHGDRPVEMLTSEDLRESYEDVRNEEENVYVSKRPSTKIFKAVCQNLVPEIQPDELRKRYDLLAQRRNSEFNKIKDPPVNLDAAEDKGVVYSKEAQMDSYKTLFCRLCFKYACAEHALLMGRDETTIMQSLVKRQREDATKVPVKKYSARNTQMRKEPLECTFEDCCENAIPEGISSLSTDQSRTEWKQILEDWSAVDRTMFNCLYESHENYCLVASLLRTKTCHEVMKYHVLSELMTGDGASSVSTFEQEVGINESARSPAINPPTPGSSGYESLSSSTANVSSGDLAVIDEEPISRELNTFVPCSHEDGKCGPTCICVLANRKCETTCGCLKSCKNRFKGCNCLTTCDTKRCPCYIAFRECDPDLCKKCGSHELDLSKVTCKNIAVQRRLRKPICVRKSNVSGWGAFAGCDINKAEFVDEYTAEIISADESERRGHIYDEKRHTYLFELTPSLNLDASRMGNSTRFINSSKKPNCQVIKTNVRGEIRLAVRALKDIKKDTELFINYHEALMQESNGKSKKGKGSRKFIRK